MRSRCVDCSGLIEKNILMKNNITISEYLIGRKAIKFVCFLVNHVT